MSAAMSDQKIPSVPATFCGLFPAAAIRFPHGNVWLVGKVNPFNAVYNGYVQTIRQLGGTAGVSYSSVEIETAALLLDSPQAMCHVARGLALKLGCDPGATAPPWFYDADTVTWKLHGMKTTFSFYGDPEGERRCFGRGWLVPDIHKVTDPAEALAAACAVVGAA